MFFSHWWCGLRVVSPIQLSPMIARCCDLWTQGNALSVVDVKILQAKLDTFRWIHFLTIYVARMIFFNYTLFVADSHQNRPHLRNITRCWEFHHIPQLMKLEEFHLINFWTNHSLRHHITHNSSVSKHTHGVLLRHGVDWIYLFTYLPLTTHWMFAQATQATSWQRGFEKRRVLLWLVVKRSALYTQK